MSYPDVCYTGVSLQDAVIQLFPSSSNLELDTFDITFYVILSSDASFC